MLAKKDVAMVERCRGHLHEDLPTLWGWFGEVLEGEGVVDLARLAGLAISGGEEDCFGHFAIDVICPINWIG